MLMKAAIMSLGSVSSKWVEDAMKKYFKKVDALDIRKIEISVGKKEAVVLYDGQPLVEYDCVYAKGSFRYLSLLQSLTSALYKKSYMPIEPGSFTTGHDKLLTQLELQKHRIPMPTTYISSTPAAAKNLLEKVNYPIIMKLPQGTQGKGVMFADSFASASSMLDALATLRQPFIIQEYVETGGVDIRAIVVGNKVIASMKRKAVSGEKRANIHAGGKGEACILDSNTQRIAVNTAKAVGAEICAVDILESAFGPVVIEVNLSPGLQGITKATKIDVAGLIAKYLFKSSKKFLASAKKDDASNILSNLGIEETNSKPKQIITTVDFRGNRILLPEIITKATEFSPEDQLTISIQKGKLNIEKFEIDEE